MIYDTRDTWCSCVCLLLQAAVASAAHMLRHIPWSRSSLKSTRVPVLRMSATAATPAGYEGLCKSLEQIAALKGIESLLAWDESVMMLDGAAQAQAAKKKVLAGIMHERETAPAAAIGKALKEIGSVSASLNTEQTAVVREAKRSYIRACRMSEELAKRKAELESESYQAWLKARKANSWNMFAPKLREHIQLARDIAAAVDPEKSAYDSNLDTFEKGITSEHVQEVFTELKAGIIPLIAELKKGTKLDGTWMQGDWDVEKQLLLCNSILKLSRS
jgi:carboxypeptidase Taq